MKKLKGVLRHRCFTDTECWNCKEPLSLFTTETNGASTTGLCQKCLSRYWVICPTCKRPFKGMGANRHRHIKALSARKWKLVILTGNFGTSPTERPSVFDFKAVDFKDPEIVKMVEFAQTYGATPERILELVKDQKAIRVPLIVQPEC